MSKTKSQIKVGILLNYVNLIVGNLIPIFYTPIMLALLGQSEYGLYKLATNVTSYLSLISLGIGSALTRFLIKANTEQGKEQEQKVFALFMIIFRIIAFATLVVGITIIFMLPLWYSNSLSSNELSRMKILVLILTINTALSFSMSPYVSIVTTHEKFIFVQGMNIITTCAGPILNLIVLFFGYASIGMAISALALSVLVRIIYFLYVRNSIKMKPIYKDRPKNMIGEILGFSFWIFLATVVNQLYNNTDTVMIGSIVSLGTVGVAVYNVGATFNNMVFGFTTGISTILTPKANKMVFAGASNSELTDLCIKVGRIQAYIISLLVSGFIAFGMPFISFYTGEEYYDAYWVAIFMMVPSMIPLVQSVCLSIIVAQNKHKFRAIVYLGIAIVNIALTWVLMNTPLGVIGAALATGIAVILGQGFTMNWYYKKKTGLQIGRFWKNIIVIYIIPVILTVITLLLSIFINFYNIVVLLLGIILFTVVYSFLQWKFVMNDYEKDLIRNPINKFIIKKSKIKRMN